MDGVFEDVWDSLDECDRVLLLEHRETRPVPAQVAAVLVRVALSVAPQPGLFPAPAHWPAGFQAFLDDKAAVVEEDPECE